MSTNTTLPEWLVTAHAHQTLYLITALTSFFACVFVISSAWCCRSLKEFPMPILLYLTIADLLVAVSIITVAVPAVIYDLPPLTFFAVLNFFQDASILCTQIWSFTFAYFCWLSTRSGEHDRPMTLWKARQRWFHFLGWGLPVLIATLHTFFYLGKDGGPKWFVTMAQNETTAVRFVIYLPMVVFWLATVTLYVSMCVSVWNALRAMRQERALSGATTKQVSGLLSRIGGYGVVYTLVWFPYIFSSLWFIFSDKNPAAIEIITGVGITLQGTLDCAILLSNRNFRASFVRRRRASDLEVLLSQGSSSIL